MKITSMDVHRKEFGNSMRGYREDEVDNFLDAIATELDRLHAQIDVLTKRAGQAESQALNFEAERNTINNALMTAQRASDDVLEKAQEQRDQILEEASTRAEKMLLAARDEKEILLAELRRLKEAENDFRAGVVAQATETVNRLKEVPLPESVEQDATRTPAAVLTEEEATGNIPAVASEAVAENPATADVPVPAAMPTSSVAVAVAPEAAVPAAAVVPAAPEIRREEGIGQYGEMEDDLETID